MAIDNPQAVKFCNERIRTAANRFAQLYYWLKAVAGEFVAQDMASKIPDTTDLVDDGSDVDGRPRISGADVNAFIQQASAFIADMEANSNAKLHAVLKIATRPAAGMGVED